MNEKLIPNGFCKYLSGYLWAKIEVDYTSFEADPSWKILLHEEINIMLCDHSSKTTKLLKSEWEANS